MSDPHDDERPNRWKHAHAIEKAGNFILVLALIAAFPACAYIDASHEKVRVEIVRDTACEEGS